MDEWMNEEMNERMSKWINNQWMSKWFKEWMNEQMHEWMNEWKKNVYPRSYLAQWLKKQSMMTMITDRSLSQTNSIWPLSSLSRAIIEALAQFQTVVPLLVLDVSVDIS